MKPSSLVSTAIEGIVLIGSSTGGTRLLPQILSTLPVLQAGILIVQHMPAFITHSFAATLGRHTSMKVRVAEEGFRLQEGEILLAPADLHCSLTFNRTIHLSNGPKVHFVRPSIDVAMQSLVRPGPATSLVGVVLTGMGRDGADGITHMKGLGALTIAQEESSCAVYGMPKAAVETGCIDYVLRPAQIAALLARQFG